MDASQSEPKPGRGKGDRRGPTIDASKLFDRDPPHSVEAEMALLGSIILDPSVVGEVLGKVSKAEQFYAEKHGLIFKALVELYDKHNSGDLVQLMDTLRGWDVLERIGGVDYLDELASSVPSSANAPYYAGIVENKHKLRRLIEAAGQILADAYTSGSLGEQTREIIDRAETAVFEIAQETESSDASNLADLLNAELERLEKMEGEGISGIPTGLVDLDDMLKGLQRGELLIVAARPSMGKTALALNLAEQIAMGGRGPHDQASGTPVPIGVFSLEMSREAVTQRMLSAYAGVDMAIFRSGKRFEHGEFASLVQKCGMLGDAPIYVDDTPGLTVMGLRARARRMAAMHGVKCIIIDYLQLLTSPSQARESRQVEVSAISRGIKALARELNVPIICLSQLNRGTEQREGNRPRMSDLRESGSIEQDADVVMLLHREEYYHVNNPDWKDANPEKVGLAELIIAKQRNGPTGVVKLSWSSASTRFKNYAGDRDGGYDEYDGGGGSAPPPPAGPPGGSSFGGREATGPISNHRDGGGPETDFDANDTGGAPF